MVFHACFLNIINSITFKFRNKEKKTLRMYVGVCMFVRMFAYYVCVYKPKFLAYAILMVPCILHWLFRSCTVLCAHLAPAASKKIWSVRTCQCGLLSVPDSSYNSRNLRNSDQTAQPRAACSAFLK